MGPKGHGQGHGQDHGHGHGQGQGQAHGQCHGQDHGQGQDHGHDQGHGHQYKNEQGEIEMDLDNLTVKEIKQINSFLRNEEITQSPFKIGEPYFIRTVTHHLTGRVKKVTAKEIVLTEAAWIADDGRFMQAVCEGKLKEVEPFPQDEEVIVGRGSLIDAVRWKHPLPKEQK